MLFVSLARNYRGSKGGQIINLLVAHLLAKTMHKQKATKNIDRESSFLGFFEELRSLRIIGYVAIKMQLPIKTVTDASLQKEYIVNPECPGSCIN
jgi:hypothetical protein